MPDASISFELRYVGARFSGRRLPVDVLSDLPAFRDLVVAFAKQKWKHLNADKKRVPKGFEDSLTFDLVDVTDGSAVPKIEWNRRLAQATLPGFADQMEEIVETSYSEAISLFDNAGAGRFPTSLSPDHIRALNKLGSSLKESERIEFRGSTGASGEVIFLDAERRKRLITKVKETYQTRIESTGKLTHNTSEGYVVLTTKRFGDVQIPLDRERVKEEFDGNLDADVEFDVQMELDHQDRYKGVVQVFRIQLIDEEVSSELARCKARIAELKELAGGWSSPEASAVHETASSAALEFLSQRPSLCSAYRIFPMESGGILFEFVSNNWDYSVEFNSDHIEMYGVSMSDSEEMPPTTFAVGDAAFLAEFDRRVGRTDG